MSAKKMREDAARAADDAAAEHDAARVLADMGDDRHASVIHDAQASALYGAAADIRALPLPEPPASLAEALRAHEEAITCEPIRRSPLDPAVTRAPLLASLGEAHDRAWRLIEGAAPAAPVGLDLEAIEARHAATLDALNNVIAQMDEEGLRTDVVKRAREDVPALLAALRAGSPDPVELVAAALWERVYAGREMPWPPGGASASSTGIALADRYREQARALLAPPDVASLTRAAVKATKAARWGAHITDERRPELWIYTVLDGLAGEMRRVPNRKARAAIAALAALLLALPEAP